MHYYQFNIGDYAGHTSRLSPMEDLAYRRMLDLYYLNESPLPPCPDEVAREIGLTDFSDEVNYVLSKFFSESETGFSQKRIDLELKRYKDNAKNKSKAGKASAKARRSKALNKGTPVEQTLNTCSSPVEQTLNTCGTNVEQNNNHKPITINQEPITSKDIKDLSQTSLAVVEKKVNSDSVDEVFKYWKSVMGKTEQTQLTPKRLKNIKARLKDNYNIEMIKQAIDGCKISPHHQGQNNQNKKYDDIELICRTGENIENFAENVNPNNSANQAANNLEGWIND